MTWYKAQKRRPIYMYHIHSTVSSNEYVENDEPTEVNEGLADDYSHNVSSGCFTKPYYYISRYQSGSHWEKRGCQHSWESYGPAGDGYYDGFRCTRCGATHGPCYNGENLPGQTDDYWEGWVADYAGGGWTYTPSSSDRSHISQTVYKCNCGHKQGELIYKED